MFPIDLIELNIIGVNSVIIHRVRNNWEKTTAKNKTKPVIIRNVMFITCTYHGIRKSMKIVTCFLNLKKFSFISGS